SFVILLLKGGLRNFLRRYSRSATGRTLYEALGGDQEGRAPAYIATAAIGAAFVLGLMGFVSFAKHHSPNDLQKQWSGRTTFLSIGAYPKSALNTENVQKTKPPVDPRGGVALEIGYKIDNLATIMFLMVTFIATLIHIFSIGYMSEELQEIVED